MFAIPKYKALTKFIKRNQVLQKTVINFDKSQYETDQTKNPWKKHENLHHFGLKNA